MNPIVDNIRILAAEVVQSANSGHPGAPMGCAPMGHAIFSQHLNLSPKTHDWINRDRFVLSNGHASALLYCLLHLKGFHNTTMDDLKQFRQLYSTTPGHPECHMTSGVEVTTGPLGQGIANAIGFAWAKEILASQFNKDEFKVIDHNVFTILGDGCMQEGVASEACSLAGHLKLGSLIALWDDNSITIDGRTEISFSEDVRMRFRAYGWHVIDVNDGNSDLEAINAAIEQAKSITDKPTLIAVKTIIGYGASKQDTAKVHGSPLGWEDIDRLRKEWNFPEERFNVLPEIYEIYNKSNSVVDAKFNSWNNMMIQYSERYPEDYEKLMQMISGKVPVAVHEALRHIEWTKPLATRSTCHDCLNAVAEHYPSLIGGSADLTGSNLSNLDGFDIYSSQTTHGRNLRFGVREHAMVSICNGIASYGAFHPFAATFLVFTGYALGALRVAALSQYAGLYQFTHDSIGVGQDGPTHQPVEVFAQLRAMPNLYFWRPADGVETAAAYSFAMEMKTAPVVVAGSRQNLPQLASDFDYAKRGGYVIFDCEKPKLTLISTGSEVAPCIEVAKKLGDIRVISMPCMEMFLEQDESYRQQVLGDVTVMAVEAGVSFGWHFLAQYTHCIDSFGISAPANDVFKHFGFDEAGIERAIVDVLKDLYSN
eukprot:TRINITY_DN2233_c0_g1_i1.p1 TRINITY_DN2233_c0_g1~~TRINITY_DN2233_c0_g1_i1.p1  ORF type:complete len:652 (+),score=218.75 TRINITY_DN2233_c0_g1_i1:35-1990(+)